MLKDLREEWYQTRPEFYYNLLWPSSQGWVIDSFLRCNASGEGETLDDGEAVEGLQPMLNIAS